MFSAKMFGMCLRYCRDYDDAKDILQDGFMKVFEKIHQFGNRGSFEGWIRKIIVNTALERYRKNNQTVSIEQIPDIHDREDEQDMYVGLSMNEMLGYIQSLPERYRMVFNLYVFEDLSHKEIAEAMDITEGTSKSDLSRARGILQSKINIKIREAANG
jgi:RNA polymerase sigma-70 factor (ECF subfamily)